MEPWDNMRIVLASASPRRIELLHQIGIQAEVMPSHKPEVVTSTDPERVVRELSRQKAEDIAGRLGLCDARPVSGRADKAQTPGTSKHAWESEPMDNTIVIGADTVVTIDGRILGKPKTHEAAYDMIRELAGRTHHVFTGVTICYPGGEETFAECTAVHVAPMSEEEIRSYANSEEPMDKAGAYGIQGLFARYISGIEGDYNNVVGLPVARLYEVLTMIRQHRNNTLG